LYCFKIVHLARKGDFVWGALMSNRNCFEGLQPQSVWAHFATLCDIPRSSYHEAALIAHLVAWATEVGIESVIDAAGNLILKKPASPGCEEQPGVILQGHLDMVCQVNAGTKHDFLHDPLNVTVRDGWLVAENTTLGADNGIGVALALAALEATDLIHPALEVLLTVNEESGMDGARELAAGALQGKTLINLDTEEWGHFYLGCAGGVDVEVSTINAVCPEPVEGRVASSVHASTSSPRTGVSEIVERVGMVLEAVPPDYALLRFDVSGLRGGHSGIDIHLGRGNAIKLLVEALRDLESHSELRLIELQGGTARNAIPREVYALCALPAEVAANLDGWVRHRQLAWRERFAGTDAGVTFGCEHLDAVPDKAISLDEQQRLLAFLDISANGVSRISEDFPDVTDTSSNLGVAVLQSGELRITFKVRSLHDDRADALADKLIAHAAGYGLHAWKHGAYPGWTPDPASPLLALCQRVYIDQFGSPAGLQVIHAGLECGLLAASHPHLEMISFGPDIRGAHAPGESVEIASVAHCWTLLVAVLQALAKPVPVPAP